LNFPFHSFAQMAPLVDNPLIASATLHNPCQYSYQPPLQN
jgi:hypothetical protein